MTQSELTLGTERTQTTTRHVLPTGPNYASLLRQLRLPGDDEASPPQIIGVTSCTRREGVSTVAANLAIQAAYSSPGSVLLIDANFAWPSVQNTFRVDRSPGLIDVIEQRVSPHECIQPSAVQQVFVLASGSGQPAVSYELGVLREFLIAAKHDYDWVFVDLGCAGEGGSPMVPFDSLDGVLLVVEAERVRSDFAKAVCDELRREGAVVLGVVMNKVRQHFPRWLDRRI